jgi:colanic acid/amylovoran biosynthesis glycosyltransferase
LSEFQVAKIAYLLHRFPRISDTFIMRELRALQKAGTAVEIISVWKPDPKETSTIIMDEWGARTRFLLPRSSVSIGLVVVTAVVRSPIRFVAAARLALSLSRPGPVGFLYQIFYLVEALLAAEILAKSEITHVHNHFGDHSGAITMVAAKLANIGYSISFHGPHVFFDGNYARIKEKVNQARFIRCISYFCRSQVMLFAGSTDIAPFKIIHCGLDLNEYQFRLPREQVHRIFCASRLAPEKGFEFLLGALRILRDQGHKLQLRLVGDGPSRLALEAMARELGLAVCVHFLGAIDEAAKNRELHASDLVVIPSLAEGLPSSATEALAVGVPVVATNIAGIGELIEHGKSGLLVRPSDPEALAEAVLTMIKDYDFRLRAAKLGRQKVMDEFDVKEETRKLQECLLQA